MLVVGTGNIAMLCMYLRVLNERARLTRPLNSAPELSAGLQKSTDADISVAVLGVRRWYLVYGIF